jgi:hypothetical protein
MPVRKGERGYTLKSLLNISRAALGGRGRDRKKGGGGSGVHEERRDEREREIEKEGRGRRGGNGKVKEGSAGRKEMQERRKCRKEENAGRK